MKEVLISAHNYLEINCLNDAIGNPLYYKSAIKY
jgi:hypothetical protein